MTKITLLLISLLLILAACSTPPAAQDFDQPNETSQSPGEDEVDPHNRLNIPDKTSITGQFQTIYIDPDQVKIIDSNMVEWPDTCLGIEQPGVECIHQSTLGYAVLLEAKGLQFAYHSNEVGSQVHPATQGLIWTREDGKDGICDRLVIFLPDTAQACWCESGELHSATVNLQEILSEEEYELLIDSLTLFSENTVNQPSSDLPDPVMVSLTFHGQGSTFPNSDQQDSLVRLAELIFSRITP